MGNNYSWRLLKFRTLILYAVIFVLGATTSFAISPYENLLAKKNYLRARNKLFSYVYTKYDLPTEYNVLLLSNIKFDSQLNDFFFNCIKIKKYNDFKCSQLKTNYNNSFFNLKKQLSSFTKNYKTKGKSKNLVSLTLFIKLQKDFLTCDKNSIHELTQLSLKVNKTLITFIEGHLPISHKEHIYGLLDFLSFPPESLKNISATGLSELNSFVHDFIRQEKSRTGKKTSLSRDIELALLFWNNVLKIKKSR